MMEQARANAVVLIENPEHQMQYVLIIATLLASPSFARSDETKPSGGQVLSWLKKLKPLPKMHYSWPLPYDKISDELLFEYVRLTHAASLSGEWGTPEQIDKAVEICARVNAGKPTKRASIGINYSVWHRRFGKESFQREAFVRSFRV